MTSTSCAQQRSGRSRSADCLRCTHGDDPDRATGPRPTRPSDRLTSLTAAAAVGDVTITVGTVAGLAADQAILIGTVGTAGTEGRKITAVNAAANQVDIDPALSNTHLVGTDVAAGPFSHRSNFSGTSYATPVCAGTGALMLSANPHLRWNQVRDILRNTAEKIDPNNTQTASHLDLADGRWRDGSGRISTDLGYTGPLVSRFYGFGRIDAAEAVRRAASEWSQVGNNNPPWSDARVADVTNYSTMQLAVANNNLYLLGRSNGGVDTWRFDTGTSTWSRVGNNNPPWSDARGGLTWPTTPRCSWRWPTTICTCWAGNGGVDTWRFDTGTSTWSGSATTTRHGRMRGVGRRGQLLHDAAGGGQQ